MTASSSAAARYARWAARTDTETRWRDPETKTESEHIDALMKQKAIGVPDEMLWERVPYSPQEIARIKALQVTPLPPQQEVPVVATEEAPA